MDRHTLAAKQRRAKIRLLFLKLWDKAVGTTTYDKHEWLELECLLGLNSSAPPPPDPQDQD
jgi:hypothetical protein